MIDDPTRTAIVDYALTVDTIRTADVVRIIVGDRDPTPADKRAAAGVLRDLVHANLLAGGRGIYRVTDHARTGPHVVTVVSDTERDDPLGRYNGPDPVAAVSSIVERIDALRADGHPIDPMLEEQVRLARAVHAANDWRSSVPAMFPSVCTRPFAPFHEEFWDWVYSVGPGETPRPYVSLWSRGTAKSSMCEMACITWGHRRARKYVLYVSGSQAKADDHVASIAELLESDEMGAIDPQLCERQLSKYGHSKGWKQNRLTTAAGFKIDAVGLDHDIRGARRGTDRVDVIVFDDVDGLLDTPLTTAKKVNRITKDLIGTQGEEGVAIMFVQNIIHGQSIAASLAELEGAPTVDFMVRRIVSGPIPAIEGFTWAEVHDEEIGRQRIVITGGEPTWPDGFGLERCQNVIDTEGLVAFLSECQHEEGGLKGSMFEDIDWDARTKDEVDLPPLHDNGTWRVGPCGTWIDPAVTSTDRSDSCAVVTDGWAPTESGGFIWRLDSWEHIASPEEATLRGLESAMRWGAQVCGFEIDQGGDTWETVFRTVVAQQLDDPSSFTYIRHMVDGVPIPAYDSRRATSDGQLSKRQRIATMQARYTTDLFRHLRSGTRPLEAGLRRFPQYKPYDVCDSAYHSWRWIVEQVGEPGARREFRMGNPSRRGASVGPIAVR